MPRWDAIFFFHSRGGGYGVAPPPPPPPVYVLSQVFGESQLEALLLEELDVEATAMLELPEEPTDLRM